MNAIRELLKLLHEAAMQGRNRTIYLLYIGALILILFAILSRFMSVADGFVGALALLFVTVLLKLITRVTKGPGTVIVWVVAIVFCLAAVLTLTSVFFGHPAWPQRIKMFPEHGNEDEDPQVIRALNLLNQQRFQEAEPLFKPLYEKYENRFDVVEGYGAALLALSRFDDAQPILQKAVDLVQSKDLGMEDYLLANNNLAQVLQDRGDYTRAEDIMRSILKSAEVFLTKQPYKVAIQHNNLGALLLEEDNSNKLAEAGDHFLQALNLDTNYYTTPNLAVAVDYMNLEEFYRHENDVDKALDYAIKAIKAFKASPRGTHSVDYASSLNNYGLVLKAKGNLNEALDWLRQAKDVHISLVGSNTPPVAVDMANIGLILEDKGDYVGAEIQMDAASKIDERYYGPDSEAIATDYCNLGNIYAELNQPQMAYDKLAIALDFYQRHYDSNSIQVADALLRIARPMRMLGNTNEALICLNRTLNIAKMDYPTNDPMIANVLDGLAQLYRAEGQFEQSQKLFVQALSIDEMNSQQTPRKQGIHLFDYALLLRDIGRLDDAKANLEKASLILAHVLSKDHPLIVKIKVNLDEIVELLKKQK